MLLHHLAYIDAGSGSYLFQLLIAGFLAGLYTLKLFWRRLCALCLRRQPARSAQDEERA